MAKSIEQEILKALDLKRKAGEDEQKFLNRVCKAIDGLDDDEWKALSDEAQKWADTNLQLYNDDKQLNTFPKDGGDKDEKSEEGKGKKAAKDEEEEEKPARKDDKPKSKAKDEGEAPSRKTAKDDEEEEEEKPSKVAKGKVDEKEKTKDKDKAKDKPKAAADKDKPKAGRKSDTLSAIKRVLVKSPNKSAADVFEILKNKGIKTTVGSVQSIRSGFRHTCKVLVDAGMLKMDLA